MKYIKKYLQIVEPEINEDGYYEVENIAIHPDIFHKQYEPLSFTLTPEEREFLNYILGRLLDEFYFETYEDMNQARYLLTRIKQYQDENKTDN